MLSSSSSPVFAVSVRFHVVSELEHERRTGIGRNVNHLHSTSVGSSSGFVLVSEAATVSLS